MKRAILLGVDPGIVDTGVVKIRIDTVNKRLIIESQVWRNVTTREKGLITVKPEFLADLSRYARKLGSESGHPLFCFVEGFRNRGRNPMQDQS